MKKVIIDYSDGFYFFREAEKNEEDRAVSVADEVYSFWVASVDLTRIVQKQLRELDEISFVSSEANETPQQEDPVFCYAVIGLRDEIYKIFSSEENAQKFISDMGNEASELRIVERRVWK